MDRERGGVILTCMRIVVGGYIVGYPLGGMTWHHLNYLLGLHELGHEVCFFEDSGAFSMPYDPVTRTTQPDSSYGRAYLERTFARYGLPLRYCYYSEFEDRHYGMSREDFEDYLRSADLMIFASGVTPLRLQRPRPRRMIVIDTDPVFTQIRMGWDEDFRNYYKCFDVAATFGRLIGTPACELPTHDIKWVGTNQPIALAHWPMMPTHSRAFTTIGQWEHAASRHIEFNGRKLLSSKSVEWHKMKALPQQVPWQMTLGMVIKPEETAADFQQHGWTLVNPEQASTDPETFARFIRDSAGEFTVAKQIYAELPSGWFSDRGAAYLASGRPVVTQDSGFDRWLPTGKGLFSFRTIEEARDALNAIAEDYPAHGAEARRIAETYFDSRKVLTELLGYLT